MATYYLPDSAGWGAAGGLGQAVKLRFKLEKSYSAANNRSSLTLTLQGYSAQYGGKYYLLDNAHISLNGSDLVNGGGSGTGSLGCYIQLAGDSSWHDLVSVSTGSTLSWTATVDHDAQGRATAALSLSYAKLFCNDNSYYAVFQNLSASQALDETRQFTLTISAGTGSTVAVTRGGSPLANGAAITYGDVLTVSFAAQSGYELTAHTVNGASFASGGTHTVTGPVAVAATAAKKTYALTISAGTGSAVTVRRGGTELADGATLTHGDLLTVSFAAQSGYRLLTHMVNGASFASGGSHTVTGAVTAAATAIRVGLLRLDTGSGIGKVRLLLDTGAAIVPARIFLDRGDRITEAGI